MSKEDWDKARDILNFIEKNNQKKRNLASDDAFRNDLLKDVDYNVFVKREKELRDLESQRKKQDSKLNSMKMPNHKMIQEYVKKLEANEKSQQKRKDREVNLKSNGKLYNYSSFTGYSHTANKMTLIKMIQGNLSISMGQKEAETIYNGLQSKGLKNNIEIEDAITQIIKIQDAISNWHKDWYASENRFWEIVKICNKFNFSVSKSIDEIIELKILMSDSFDEALDLWKLEAFPTTKKHSDVSSKKNRSKEYKNIKEAIQAYNKSHPIKHKGYFFGSAIALTIATVILGGFIGPIALLLLLGVGVGLSSIFITHFLKNAKITQKLIQNREIIVHGYESSENKKITDSTNVSDYELAINKISWIQKILKTASPSLPKSILDSATNLLDSVNNVLLAWNEKELSLENDILFRKIIIEYFPEAIELYVTLPVDYTKTGRKKAEQNILTQLEIMQESLDGIQNDIYIVAEDKIAIQTAFLKDKLSQPESPILNLEHTTETDNQE